MNHRKGYSQKLYYDFIALVFSEHVAPLIDFDFVGCTVGVHINAKFAINLLHSYKKHSAIKSLCIFFQPRVQLSH